VGCRLLHPRKRLAIQSVRIPKPLHEPLESCHTIITRESRPLGHWSHAGVNLLHETQPSQYVDLQGFRLAYRRASMG